MSQALIQRRSESANPRQNLPLTDWLVGLSHDSPFEQPQTLAAHAANAPPPAAMASLLFLLKDANPDVRLRAITALGDLAEEVRRVLPALGTTLGDAAIHDPDSGVRAEAVRALLKAGPQPATEVAALVDALHDKLEIVRFHAAIALGDLRRAGRPAVPDLIHAGLWDEEPAVRVGAAMALWKIDGKRPLVVDVLSKALGDSNELVCWIAAESLGEMGPEAREAVPALRQALQRDFKISLVRTSIRLALKRMEPDTAAAAG